jgi:hypothetical protein
MKIKKVISKIFDEVIASGIGWVAGILSIDLLDKFFIKKSIWNFGGIFSKRVAVSKDEFSLLEWLLTAIIGFVVMILVNKLINSKLIKKKFSKTQQEEVQTEEHVISTVYEESASIIQEEETTTESEDNLNQESQITEDDESDKV